MLKFLLGPDDWLGRRQGLCLFLLFVGILIVGALTDV